MRHSHHISCCFKSRRPRKPHLLLFQLRPDPINRNHAREFPSWRLGAKDLGQQGPPSDLVIDPAPQTKQESPPRMSITVRPITEADYAAVARITADAYLGAGYFDSAEYPYMQKIMQVAERAAVAPVIVAERDGVVIGSATLAVHGEHWADVALPDELEFRLLVVDPAVQRSGAGKAMVAWIMERARTLPGIAAVSLTTGDTWHTAHSLYLQLGFKRVPERDWIIPENGKMLRVYRMGVGSR